LPYNQMEVLVYVCRRSWRCWLTRRLLERQGYHFEVIDATDDPELCSWLARFTGRETMPYVFIDHRPVGSFGEIRSLETSGALEHMVRGEV
jgi:glutaredoxin